MAGFLRCLFGLAIFALPLAGCVTDDQPASQATGTWRKIKQEKPVTTDPRYTSRLNRVAPIVLRASGQDPSQWEWAVFEDDSLNAFALPGNKFALFTGILDIMENDAQIATVVGHEVAHVLYRHSAKRTNQNVLASVGVIGATIALGAGCESGDRACQQRSETAAQVAGAAALYGALLPYSRKHELEADVAGLQYMNTAGYDVCEAIAFWNQMTRASAGQPRPAEFASTHPASERRVRTLRAEAERLGKSCR